MRIVFPDGTGCVQSPEDLEPLRALGPVDFHNGPPRDKAELIRRLRDAEAVIIALHQRHHNRRRQVRRAGGGEPSGKRVDNVPRVGRECPHPLGRGVLPMVGPLVVVLAFLVAPALAAPAMAGSTNIPGVDDYIDAPRALFGTTREAIEARLGEPVSVRERLATDLRDPPVTRTVQELAYPGVVIRVSSSATLLRVQVTDARFPLPHGLTIGVSRREIQEILGEPQQVTDTRVLYLYSDGYPDTVEFHFRGDRVHRIEWNYWVD